MKKLKSRTKLITILIMIISLIGCKDNIFLAKMLRKPKLYKVEHYQQNIKDNKYTLVKADTQKLFGETGETTKAKAKTYPGFKPAKAFSQVKIKADGSTVIKIYYDRKEISLTLKPAGGKINGSTANKVLKARYGTKISATAPTKTGYIFAGWKPALPKKYTVEANDKSYTALWAELKVSGISLNKSELVLNVEQTETLKATVQPANETNKSLTWTSSNKAITTVDAKGKVTAKKVGVATITVTTKDGNKKASCKVTVKPIAVTAVKLSETTKSLKEGESFTLVATVLPANATEKGVIWASTDTAVATVDKNGKVTAKENAEGKTATITVTTTDGNKKVSCTVTILVKPVAFVEIKPPEGAMVTSNIGDTAGGGYNWKGVFVANRSVKLSPYKLGEKEVTYNQWREVYNWAIKHGYKFADPQNIMAGSHETPGINSETKELKAATNNGKHPVTCVSWQDCIVWCNAYTEKTKGADQCVYRSGKENSKIIRKASEATVANLSINQMKENMKLKGYRLPTEAEWEYAARWQKDNTNNNAVNYGTGENPIWLTKLNALSGASGDYNDTTASQKVAWYEDSDGSDNNKTHEVGKKKANESGLYDMSGNVREWCFDRIGSWDEDPTENDSEYTVDGVVKDPMGVSAGSDRAYRGGSWYDFAEICSVGYRDYSSPDDRGYYLGFRLAYRP